MYIDPILRKFSFADLDDLYAAVGCGGIAAQQVVTRLREEQRAHDKPLVPVLPRVAEPMPLHGGKSTSKEDMGIKIAGLPGMSGSLCKMLYTASGRRNRWIYYKRPRRDDSLQGLRQCQRIA